MRCAQSPGLRRFASVIVATCVLALAGCGGDGGPTGPTVAVTIDAFDHRGLVRDISSVLADEHIAIQAMNTVTDAAENTATVDVTVAVHGLDELSRLLSRFAGLPNVIRARRRR